MASTDPNSGTRTTGPSTKAQPQKPAAELVLSLSHHLATTTAAAEDNSEKIHLILASQSPRRKEILDMMGLQDKFTQQPSPLDETALQQQLQHLVPKEYTVKLAEEKAKALAMTLLVDNTHPFTLVLGSDTIVDLEGKILEKPTDTKVAKEMLQTLAGRQHQVHTGVAVYLVSGSDKQSTKVSLVDSFTDTANVWFADLSEDDIDAYIATKEPMDKAGAYGIQGIGGQLVRQVQGDFFTVMGLPMHPTSKLLAQAIKQVQQLQTHD